MRLPNVTWPTVKYWMLGINESCSFWLKETLFLEANETGQPGLLPSLALLPSKMNHLKWCTFFLALLLLSVSADDSLFFFFTSGLRRIYYEQLAQLPVSISSACGKSLLQIYKHLNLGHEWAHRFIDSSASTPVSVFTGTVTNLGSFDSCINSKEASQYCLIESVPSGSFHQSSAFIKLQNILPSLSFFNITSGICMPKTCDTNDVKNLWSFWLSKYSMQLVNSHKIACSGDNSGENGVPFYALCALLFIICSQLLIGMKSLLLPGDSAVEKIFSPFLHMKELFNTSDRSATVVDCLKVFMILMGISAHCLLCIEKLVAIALLGNMNYLKNVFGQFWVQGLNEQGFDFFAVLGGFTLFRMSYHSKIGQITFWRTLLLEKYLSLVPATLGLILLELTWPVFSSGPFHVKLTREVVHDCTQNWWKHLLLVANHDPVRSCVGHTFFTSIHLHLLFLGLNLVWLLRKNERLAICVFIATVTSVYWYLFIQLQGIQSPVLLSWQLSVPHVIDYLSRVHFPTYTHIPPFFAGILIAYALETRMHLFKKLDVAAYSCTVLTLLGTVSFSPAIHNYYHAIPPDMYPLFIVSMRILFVLSTPHIIAMTILLAQNRKKNSPSKTSDERQEKPLASQMNDSMTSNFIRFLSRLTFSMHMVNYAFIKYDFANSRFLYFVYPMKSLERIMYSITIIIFLALPFHIFIIAPFVSLKRLLLHQLNK